MKCLDETTLTRQRDHYHSRECKTCEYCHLTAAFPRPWVDKPGDPVDYFQDYTPHCLVCRYANDWLFDETLNEGEEHSFMEYKNRVEISQSVKGPLNEIHARLAVKDIHDKIEKALDNITSSCVARTRPIKSEFRLLTDWQTEILEIMEANGVSEETIGKVLDLL